ncbi:proline iminopeptidase [Hypoxylon trugodes]|uniref:proline iminopeptidase n=1 Tax=Hypoxylon trugodes TaxID=326681 RepID=UPI00219BDC09|nr:proline iminopeptidase [Hypoxylon trugodes]KAI1384382.1 proline iminopeptidase [Hypoxylon trugodes]
MAAGYVHSEPFDSGYLPVGSIHQLYYEQYGLKTGLPVVFLHGGPGGKAGFSNTKFFNPKVYRVVLFDQRGAGRSRPRAETAENTAQLLVSDIETLREHLAISKWHMVFGGSWGATLGLLYAQTHPERVGSLVLRGVWTAREQELEGHRGNSSVPGRVYPDMRERFVNFIPEGERHDLIAAYYKRLTSDNPEVVSAAAREWNRWDLSLGSLRLDPKVYDALEDEEWCLAHAKLEAHYVFNHCFMEEGHLLDKKNIEKMKHIPGAIVQGRYDLVTPPQTAWDLHKAWPNSILHWIPDAGHSVWEPGTFAKLVEVCDDFANIHK